MDLLLRIIIGAVALLFLFMGLGYLFDPAASALDLSLTPVGEHGLNTIRGDMAGLFLASTVLLGLGLLQRKVEWFLSARRVMTLGWVEGIPSGDVAAIDAAGLDRAALGERVLAGL